MKSERKFIHPDFFLSLMAPLPCLPDRLNCTRMQTERPEVRVALVSLPIILFFYVASLGNLSAICMTGPALLT